MLRSSGLAEDLTHARDLFERDLALSADSGAHSGGDVEQPENEDDDMSLRAVTRDLHHVLVCL